MRCSAFVLIFLTLLRSSPPQVRAAMLREVYEGKLQRAGALADSKLADLAAEKERAVAAMRAEFDQVSRWSPQSMPCPASHAPSPHPLRRL